MEGMGYLIVALEDVVDVTVYYRGFSHALVAQEDDFVLCWGLVGSF